MAEFTLEESEQFVTIPDGEILEAEVTNCEHRETPWEDEKNPGTKKWEVSFRFMITQDGDYYGRTLFGRTPTTFSTHPDCKLRVWVQELLCEDSLPAGFKFDTSALIGLPCRVAIGVYEKKAADGTAVPKNTIQDVLRPSSTRLAEEVF